MATDIHTNGALSDESFRSRLHAIVSQAVYHGTAGTHAEFEEAALSEVDKALASREPSWTLEQIEANDRYVLLTDELSHIFGEQDRRDYAVQAKEIMAELAEERAATEKLEAIAAWCAAYPVESFLPLAKSEWKVARLALLRENLSIDRISADNYRHVLAGVSKIINPPAPEVSKR